MNLSPLRYPGGKQILLNPLRQILRMNKLLGKSYVEPFAGGAGAALGLLFDEYVSDLRLNDADVAIYSFWKAILHDTDRFLSLLRKTPLTVDEWNRQKKIYENKKSALLKLGFSAFYLNRCNRSGIISGAGVIGGLAQNGPWKIDARFNRVELERRITAIALYSDRISISNKDAIEFLEDTVNIDGVSDKCFVYLDPPYYNKGSQLYLNHYLDADHRVLASYLNRKARFKWMLTYDDTEQIKALYSNLRVIPFHLRYSVQKARSGSELLITRKGLRLPNNWECGNLLAC